MQTVMAFTEMPGLCYTIKYSSVGSEVYLEMICLLALIRELVVLSCNTYSTARKLVQTHLKLPGYLQHLFCYWQCWKLLTCWFYYPWTTFSTVKACSPKIFQYLWLKRQHTQALPWETVSNIYRQCRLRSAQITADWSKPLNLPILGYWQCIEWRQ